MIGATLTGRDKASRDTIRDDMRELLAHYSFDGPEDLVGYVLDGIHDCGLSCDVPQEELLGMARAALGGAQ